MPTAILEEILKTRKVHDAAGRTHDLHSNIDENEGRYISQLISQFNCRETLETGCAYGISSLYICQALSAQPQPSHTIIDPMENSVWKSVGITNLQQAGYEFFTLIEEGSEFALPRLLREGRKFDFALLDSWHTFDHAMIEFYYINRLLRLGGVVVIDDAQFPALQRLVNYVSNYPAYKIVEAPPRLRTMVALTKIAEDQRRWDWYAEF